MPVSDRPPPGWYAYRMAFMESALREVHDVARATTLTHRFLRGRLIGAFVFTLVVDLLASAAIFFAERHAPGTEITSFGDALFFTTTQLTTVSSQLPNPLSVPGRVIDVVLELYGITVVAALAGSFGAFFHHRSMEMRRQRGDPIVEPDSGTA